MAPKRAHSSPDPCRSSYGTTTDTNTAATTTTTELTRNIGTTTAITITTTAITTITTSNTTTAITTIGTTITTTNTTIATITHHHHDLRRCPARLDVAHDDLVASHTVRMHVDPSRGADSLASIAQALDPIQGWARAMASRASRVSLGAHAEHSVARGLAEGAFHAALAASGASLASQAIPLLGLLRHLPQARRIVVAPMATGLLGLFVGERGPPEGGVLAGLPHAAGVPVGRWRGWRWRRIALPAHEDSHLVLFAAPEQHMPQAPKRVGLTIIVLGLGNVWCCRSSPIEVFSNQGGCVLVDGAQARLASQASQARLGSAFGSAFGSCPARLKNAEDRSAAASFCSRSSGVSRGTSGAVPMVGSMWTLGGATTSAAEGGQAG